MILPKSVWIVAGGIIGTALGLMALDCALTYALGAELQIEGEVQALSLSPYAQAQQPPSLSVPPSISPLTRQCLLSEGAEREAMHAIEAAHLAQIPNTNPLTKDFLQGQVEMFLTEAYRLQFGGQQR